MAMMLQTAALCSRPPVNSVKQQAQAQQQQQTTSTKIQHRVSAAASKSISMLAVFSVTAGDARAFSLPKEQIISSLDKAESTIEVFQDVIAKIFDAVKGLTETVKPGVDAALPVLQSASQEALKVASPVVSDASKQAKEVLQSAGVDPSPVITAAKTVVEAAGQTSKIIEGAKPIASATAEKITSDPSVIVVSAGALFIAYLLVPPVWSIISYSFRGYKGSLTPAQVLDLISTQNYVVIDIRSEKDKNKAGTPRLPSSAKNKLISVPLEDLPNKIKGLVRNSKKTQTDIAALKISYLKRVNKGSNIIIMDSYSDEAKMVAKTLTSLGFKNCWIMTDGFSGGKGWLQSRLGADSYNVLITEIITPSRIIPATSSRVVNVRSESAQPARKLLPGTIDK